MNSVPLTTPQPPIWSASAAAECTLLADVLLGRGWTLSGSDLTLAAAGDLAASGVRLFAGHAAGHLPPQTQWVIASSAIPADNPELQAAAARRIPVLSYFSFSAG